MTALSENGGALGFGLPSLRIDDPAARTPELVVDDRPTVSWDDGTATPDSAPGTPAPTRAEQRRQAELAARAHRSRAALWRAWWVYPLVGAALLCGWLGVQSASAPAPAGPVVVSVPSGG